MKKVNFQLEELKDIEILTSEGEELNSLKEDLNQAFKQYHDVMETEEDREGSYRYFDLIDHEFSELCLKISSRIHAAEKRAFEEKLSVKSSHSSCFVYHEIFQIVQLLCTFMEDQGCSQGR